MHENPAINLVVVWALKFRMPMGGVEKMPGFLSWFSLLILCANCLADIQYPQNSDLYVYVDAEENITDVTTNVPISIGTDEAPCKAPNFCWQLVSRRKYAIIGGRLTGENAAAIFYPVDRHRQPVALVYKKMAGVGGDPIIPSNVRIIETIYVSPAEKVNQRLIFDSEIRSIYVVGSIGLKPTPDTQLLLITTWNTNLKDMIFMTGRMNATVLNVMITKANETVSLITLAPTPLPPLPPPIYVSWSVEKAIASAGKQTKTLFQCINECQRKYYQYLG